MKETQKITNGMHNFTQEGHWTWLRTGHWIDYQPWGKLQPDNGFPGVGHSEECLEMRTSGIGLKDWHWNDLGCYDLVHHPTKPICEIFF